MGFRRPASTTRSKKLHPGVEIRNLRKVAPNPDCKARKCPHYRPCVYEKSSAILSQRPAGRPRGNVAGFAVPQELCVENAPGLRQQLSRLQSGDEFAKSRVLHNRQWDAPRQPTREARRASVSGSSASFCGDRFTCSCIHFPLNHSLVPTHLSRTEQ
jgi:hypothetical protein